MYAKSWAYLFSLESNKPLKWHSKDQLHKGRQKKNQPPLSWPVQAWLPWGRRGFGLPVPSSSLDIFSQGTVFPQMKAAHTQIPACKNTAAFSRQQSCWRVNITRTSANPSPTLADDKCYQEYYWWFQGVLQEGHILAHSHHLITSRCLSPGWSW